MSPRRLWLPLLSVALTIGAQAAPPKPDFANLPAYIRALNASHDPQAIAIRKQIAVGPAALARERAAAQTAGVPLDVQALQRPMPPADQNAAPLYAQWDALRRQNPMRPPMYAQSLRYGYAYTPEQLEAVRTQYAAHQDALALLHQATDRPQYGSTRTWSFTDFPNYALFREGAREINTESYLLAADGKYADAVADQARGFHIAGHVGSQPTLISHLVAVAVDAITLSGMKNILYLAGPDAAVDTQVRQAIAAARPRLSLKYALLGEAAITFATLGPLDKMGAAQFSTAFAPGTHTNASLPVTPQERHFVHDFLSAAEAQYLSRMLPLIAAADLSGPTRRAAFAANERSDPYTQSLNPVMALDAIFTPTFTQVEQKDDFIHAQEQVTMAAAAVLAARAGTGAFPESLPDGFLDPFTGKPLGYRREGDNGFVVYSVGGDGTFRGGAQGEQKFNPVQAFFRYPGPTPQPVPPDMLK